MIKYLLKTILHSCVLLIFSVTTNAQTQIIINEFSQGPSNTDNEWIELVLTGDTLTDISGVYFDDDGDLDANSNRWDDKQVQFRSDVAELQTLPKGTIIVIYKGNTGIDPKILPLVGDSITFGANNTIIIPHTNNDWLVQTPPATWPGLLAVGDAFGILNSDGTGIHGIAYGMDGSNHSGTWAATFPSGSSWGMTDLTAFNIPTGRSTYFIEDTPGEASTDANWSFQASSSASPGDLNGGNNNALPVELTSFAAILKENAVQLNWMTATEVNNYGFDIERKREGENWKTLGFVEGHGNTNSPKEYTFLDSDVAAAGKYFYRLKQIDNDGTYEYSKSIFVDLDAPVKFDLKQNFPNPFNPSTTISFNLPYNEYVTLKVFNAIGEEVQNLFEGNLDAGIHMYNFIGDELPSGLYVYMLSTNSLMQTKKMLLLK